MDNKTLYLIIGVVAIVIVAGVAAYALIGDDSEPEKDNGDDGDGAVDDVSSHGTFQVTKPLDYTRLMVFGNANNDDDINSSDRQFVKDIVDGKTVWDKNKNPYADVNANGAVDKFDLELLDKILNKEKCKVYFTQYWAYEYSTSFVHYPVNTDRIGVMYYYQADLAELLGIWDKVAAIDNRTLNNPKYPCEGMANLGEAKTMDMEAVVKAGVTVLIAHMSSGTGEVIQADLRKAGSDIDVISVPYMGVDCFAGALTMGFLLDVKAAADKYVDWSEGVIDDIIKKTKGVAKNDLVQYVNTYNPQDKGKIRIQGLDNKDGTISGDLSFISQVPSVNLVHGMDNQFHYVEIEWFLQNQPDYIVISMSGSNSGITYEEGKQKFENYLPMFKETDAYKNKNIIGCSYACTATYGGASTLMLLAHAYYPTVIDEELGWKYIQEWYDTFTLEKVDAKKIGGCIYTME